MPTVPAAAVRLRARECPLASLFVIWGNDQGTRFELSETRVRIGRDADNTIQLHDAEASRHHAELQREGSHWVLLDCGSSNGTFVNSRRVQRHVLRSGDQIQVGRTLMLFTAEEEQAGDGTGVQIRRESPEEPSRIIHTVRQEQGSQILQQALLGPAELESPHARALRLVYEAARTATGTLDIHQLLQRILKLVFEFVHADRGCVLLAEGDDGHLQPAVQMTRGTRQQEPLVISQTILDYVLQHRQGVLTTNAQADQRWTDAASVRRLGIREAICVPMLGRYGLVGAMYIDTAAAVHEVLKARDQQVRFTPEHLTLLMAIAHQTALAVEDTRYYQAMVQAERLAAIGQAVAMLSHHIKNILQGIRGGSFLIKDGLQRGDEQMLRRGWEFVEKNQQRISDLVLNMLTFSKEREPELAQTNLNQLVQDVVELAANRAREMEVQLQFEPCPELPLWYVDPDAIHHALLNVVINAVEACAGAEPARVLVRVHYHPHRQEAEIAVQDTGPGIPPEQLQRIFEPFVSTKGNRGTGLGLPVSRKLLREHGGDIRVESTPGQGSTFRLVIPAAKPAARESTGEKSSANEPATGESAIGE